MKDRHVSGVETLSLRHPDLGSFAMPREWTNWAPPGEQGSSRKERAMHDKFSRRIAEALERLSARIARSKKRLDPSTVNRQVGRILQQNQRAAARFKIKLEPDGSPAGFRLSVACDASFDDWAALSEGA